MEELQEIIDNEFSSSVIERMDLKYDCIGKLVSAHMSTESFGEIRDELYTMLGDSSKDYFIQGFLRGMAAAKSGTL